MFDAGLAKEVVIQIYFRFVMQFKYLVKSLYHKFY